eukprot:COSAG01_NODE_7396_length_3224_cov_2.790250_3_plen_109_part_00
MFHTSMNAVLRHWPWQRTLRLANGTLYDDERIGFIMEEDEYVLSRTGVETRMLMSAGMPLGPEFQLSTRLALRLPPWVDSANLCCCAIGLWSRVASQKHHYYHLDEVF